ncbi:response regulator [Sulfitobacter sp. Ks41]|uniref:response regulator n=1 Tax=Sulfitobacter sp. Ks41 TaxID=2731139 RepID=UPI0023E1E639|nr:response regulator [Sulfitobacter sp. Ks41]MDF3361936.1 response regulator [Sulfitobacter sp. Ks41]
MVKILLVEDELLVGMDIKMTLEDEGFEVDGPYPTVAEALTVAKTATPNLGFLDVRLADGAVDPLASWLLEKSVPLVFHSGHAEAHDYGARYPGAGFCEKPSTPAELVSVVIQQLTKLQT